MRSIRRCTATSTSWSRTKRRRRARLGRAEFEEGKEVRVAGRPVRFDFRHVGDGYYDARWQRDMLSRSVLTADGVRVPAPRDAFFSLVYHALVQKREVASDYLGKAMDLSRAAGIAVGGFDAAFAALEEFLAANGYGAPRPSDKSVFYDADLLRWREVASDCAASLPVKALRPVRTDARHADSVRHALHFTGETAEGVPCGVDYLTAARETAETDWTVGRLFQSRFPRHAVKILFYRLDRHAERHGVVVREAVKGRTFAEAAAVVSPEAAADLARELTAIGRELAELGLCHRDLGPETLWVADDGSVKISSFRFAVKRGDGRETQFLSKRWKSLVTLGATAVDFDTLDTDVLLQQCRRQQRQGFGNKTVQSLAGIVLSDGHFSHRGPPLIWFYGLFYPIFEKSQNICKKMFDKC